ncbi:MAG: hypothetical protein KAU28_10790, partial [Phycisphaerae bacterium]|nr:hypothetical protein [Phycisphaerae bacterium]
FTSQGTDMETLRGRGAVFLDDIDFSRYRLINGILGFIGISSAKLIGSSDVEGVFRIRGPVMVLESGCHLSNRLAAIEAEPGGTINVRTKEIDIYIVAGQFREIRHILTSLPLLGVPLADPVNLVSHLLNKLFRLHLKGKWDDPPTKLIREEPLTNIGTGTTEFFRGAVKTGGQLGPGVLEMFSDLIKPRENNDKKNQ